MTDTVGPPTRMGKARKPGFLLEPLGWIYNGLSEAIDAQPRLLEHLFDLDTARMHLIALALAHLTTDVSLQLALTLLQGSTRSIMKLSLGQRPIGLDRALRHLPSKVFPAESYRNLVNLLNDPVPAKFLHHAKAITETTIAGLHNLPSVLRTAPIVAMFNRIEGMAQFGDGLGVLAARSKLPFETVTREIAAQDQPEQVAAKIKEIINKLPLPTTLPPLEVGSFRRLDAVADIRQLAKNWNNCLAEHLFNVNEGTSAIYLSQGLKSVCSVGREGRMGWFLTQTKGPRNAPIPPSHLAEIQDTFAGASLPPNSLVHAIKGIVHNDEWSCPHRAINDDGFYENMLMN